MRKIGVNIGYQISKTAQLLRGLPGSNNPPCSIIFSKSWIQWRTQDFIFGGINFEV